MIVQFRDDECISVYRMASESSTPAEVGFDDSGIEIWADGADPAWMQSLAKDPRIFGFTTNPSLVRAAGISDYAAFGRAAVRAAAGKPVCIGVFSDTLAGIERQALRIATWGPQVWTKVPIMTTSGESCVSLIGDLCRAGVQVNATAVLTVGQVELLARHLPEDANVIVSVFAGRIADTGRDPIPLLRDCKKLLVGHANARLLWASAREVLNLLHSRQAGCDAITMPQLLLRKLDLIGKDLDLFSQETVAMFRRDAIEAGLYLPGDCGCDLSPRDA